MGKILTFATVDGRSLGPLTNKDISRLKNRLGVTFSQVVLSDEEVERQKAEDRRQKTEGRRQKAARIVFLPGLEPGGPVRRQGEVAQ